MGILRGMPAFPSPPSVVVLGALPEELAAFAPRIHHGGWAGVQVATALTGVGKVNAAATAQRLIDRHRPAAVVFTGVAGALDPRLRVGDVGVGVAAIDADFDIRAWQPGARRGELPFGGGRVWPGHPALVAAARTAAAAVAPGRFFDAFIATGSAFLDTAGKRRFMAEILPDLAAQVEGEVRTPDLIEMEGSAVMQVAAANRVPALAIRAVSDALAGDAVADFNAFIGQAAERYALVVEAVLARIAAAPLDP